MYLFHILVVLIVAAFVIQVRLYLNKKKGKIDPDKVIGNKGNPHSSDINEFGGFVEVENDDGVNLLIRAKTYNKKVVKSDEEVLVTGYDKSDDFFIVDKI